MVFMKIFRIEEEIVAWPANKLYGYKWSKSASGACRYWSAFGFIDYKMVD
jgi:hypothetical protein